MADPKTYRLDATREGRWWIIDAPEVEYRSQARTLADVDEMGRDLIAGALDVDPASFDVEVRVQQPADVAAKLDAVAHWTVRFAGSPRVIELDTNRRTPIARRLNADEPRPRQGWGSGLDD